LRDPNGAIAVTPITIVLQPQQQLARFVDELFSSDVVSAGFAGSLRLQSAAPFSVLGFRFSGAAFSTLPVGNNVAGVPVPSRTLAAGAMANTPLAGVVGGSSAITLPQFAMAGGWATQLALVNSTGSNMSGRVDIFDVTGNPMAVKLNRGMQSTFVYSIAPGGMFLLAPRDANGQSPF
jgi:hypothetical protein